MKRLGKPFVYSDGPIKDCYWSQTAPLPPAETMDGDMSVDVAIIGGGFTGLSAALHLAEAGVDVAVLDAKHPGWGASGRNGGFCCLGGAKASEDTLRARLGEEGLRDYRLSERDAVDLVDGLISRLGLDVDRHSRGETQLAHRARDLAGLEQGAADFEKVYGKPARFISKDELEGEGLRGPFHGAMEQPIGFALNPRKYVAGLASGALAAGARLFADAAVTGIARKSGGYDLKTARGTVSAKQIILATNGYSSEDVPEWMAGRYMPTQSTVLVTRPMSDAELDAQGWTSDQLAYDTRTLLHYFRLMPNRRFLFGMRGGVSTGALTDRLKKRALRRHFEQMFPAWAHVESPYAWSGFVCLSQPFTPFAGEVPGHPGMFAGFAYHGNGVAMGSYTGALLADGILGRQTLRWPEVMRREPGRFAGGPFRRLGLHGGYFWYWLKDL